jgi:hypothetical protein
MIDTCCCCGEYVGEGRQVCTQCMSAIDISNVSDKTILHIRIAMENPSSEAKRHISKLWVNNFDGGLYLSFEESEVEEG